VAWALPTVPQVEAEVQQGHYAQAEGMMREVVQAKPGSAKAHYIYAEILAHNGSFSKAAEEAREAKRLDPDIKFTEPEKFQSFEKLLEREQRPAQRTTTSSSVFPAVAPATAARSQAAGIPSWVWLAALGVVGYVLWRGFARSQAAGASPSGAYGVPGAVPANGYGAAPTGYGSSPYMNTPAAAPGGGLLRTGLAVAGGVAAGMMVDELLQHRQGSSVGSGTDTLSGLQHGIFDASPADDAARELEQRNVDFGNGNDWDAGGGSMDSGSSGSDDGGW
jgi:hypothetical protein